MEEDSLLAQALKHNANQNNNHNHGDTLVVDVFLLPTTNLQDTNDSSAIRQRMLALADLGVKINDFLQKRYREDSYPWMQGGDGPVFGIHASPAVDSGNGNDDDGNCEQSVLIPHLRAECR